MISIRDSRPIRPGGGLKPLKRVHRSCLEFVGVVIVKSCLFINDFCHLEFDSREDYSENPAM